MSGPPGPYPPARRSRGPLIAGLVAAAVVVLLIVGGAAYALLPGDKPRPPKPPAAQPACGYKIAYLGILSGENNGDGETIRNASRLAVDKYNREHDGCTTEMVEYDTKGDDDEAARLADQLAKDEKILGVVGPVWYSEALKAMPILDAAGVSVISPSLSYSGLSQKGWKTFHRTVGTDTDQAAAAARYLTTVMRAQKIFIVADNDEHGTAVASELRLRLNTAAAGRVDITGSETTYAEVVGQINSATADAVYFAGYYDAGGLLVKQLREAKPGIKVLAWDRIFTNSFIEAAGKPAAEGVVITCPCLPPSEARNNFANDYRGRFEEAGYYGPEAYDAANILLAALNAGNDTRDEILSYVTGYEGEGVSRRVNFTATGDLDNSSPTVWAYQVKNGGVFKEQVITLR
jgi:branched-chain amino acid transport system substrate-binding protein